MLRTGRHLGRTLYLQTGHDADSQDVFIGIMDSAEVAELIVDQINRNPWVINEIRLSTLTDSDDDHPIPGGMTP